MTIFDARTIARGWLAVAIASGTDDSAPALCRTVAIEAYSEGVRLVATDSYVLLRSWVPNIEHEWSTEPDLDSAPYATAVAIDPHGRAKGFLAHVLRIAANDDADDPVEVRLNLGVVDEVEASARPAFEGMEARYVVLELVDAERLKLHTYDGAFPNWRTLAAGFKSKATKQIALAPDIVGRLAKLGKIHPAATLGFSWGGELGAAHVELLKSDPPVEGLVMPCRWDFDRNSPYVEPDPDPGPPAADGPDDVVDMGARKNRKGKKA